MQGNYQESGGDSIAVNPDNADADSGDAILDHERGEHVAEDGGDVRHSSVGAIIRLMGVGEDLVAIDAEELAGREGANRLELVAQGAGKRITLYLGELGDLYPGRIEFAGGAHAGEDLYVRQARGGVDEQSFVGQRVDGINNKVESGKWKVERILRRIALLDGCDVGVGIDQEQAFAEHLDLRLTDGGGSGHELAVDVRGNNHIAVNDGQVMNT